jgi:hypothetical protein
VLFDDLSGGDLVDASEVERIDYDTIELHLQGEDLMHDNVLRAGLTTMWRAEANLAGLTVDAMFPLGDNDAGIADGDTWILAEFNISGTTHIVRATRSASSPTTVIVRADRANRWDGFF